MNEMRWDKGFSDSVLACAESRFGFTFPPDLRQLLLERSPRDGHDWGNHQSLDAAFNWPLEGLLFDVQYNNTWLPSWGQPPASLTDRLEHVTAMVAEAPRLLPLISHRYLPAFPIESGNPVFSVMQSDIIHYGANLEDYFLREFGGWDSRPWPSEVKHIPFWSDIVDWNRG